MLRSTDTALRRMAELRPKKEANHPLKGMAVFALGLIAGMVIGLPPFLLN